MSFDDGCRHEGVTIPGDESRALADAYGFSDAGNPLEQAGALCNLLRVVNRDGLLIMLVLSHYLEKGEDALPLVMEALAAAGFNLRPVPEGVDITSASEVFRVPVYDDWGMS